MTSFVADEAARMINHHRRATGNDWLRAINHRPRLHHDRWRAIDNLRRRCGIIIARWRRRRTIRGRVVRIIHAALHMAISRRDDEAATATPVKTWPTVAHSRSPARADCKLAPASATTMVPVRINFFIIFPFIRTLLRSISLTREIYFYSKRKSANVSNNFMQPPVSHKKSPRRKLPRSFKDLTPAKHFNPAHFFSRAGLEGAGSRRATASSAGRFFPN